MPKCEVDHLFVDLNSNEMHLGNMREILLWRMAFLDMSLKQQISDDVLAYLENRYTDRDVRAPHPNMAFRGFVSWMFFILPLRSLFMGYLP